LSGVSAPRLPNSDPERPSSIWVVAAFGSFVAVTQQDHRPGLALAIKDAVH